MTIYIVKETTCPTCKGEGVVQPPIWAEYWRWALAFKQEYGRLPTPGEEPVWAADLPASEETTCPDCAGLGVVTEKVEMSEVLAALRELASQLAEAYQSAEGVGPAAERLAEALSKLGI